MRGSRVRPPAPAADTGEYVSGVRHGKGTYRFKDGRATHKHYEGGNVEAIIDN